MQIAAQPIIDTQNRITYAFEVLSRNTGDTFTPPPSQHIFWASIDHKALVLAQLHIPAGVHIAVNLSEATLSTGMFFDSWVKCIEAKAKTGKVSVEITEEISDHTLAARWPLLKSLPIKLFLDDFGRENNQLARLQKYDWDAVKFEIEFFDGENGLNAIQEEGLKWCKQHGITVIAERIDSPAKANFAQRMGFRLQQGYLFGKPQLVDEELGSMTEQATG